MRGIIRLLSIQENIMTQFLMARSMNVFLFVFVAILVLEISVCTMQLYLFIPNLKTCALSPVTPAADCQHGFGDYFFYLGDDTTAVLDNLLSFMVLFNYIIPISLYVTIGNVTCLQHIESSFKFMIKFQNYKSFSGVCFSNGIPNYIALFRKKEPFVIHRILTKSWAK